MDINRLADMRPRFVWDIIDDAFDLYREQFSLLLGVTAVVAIPANLLSVAWSDIQVKPITDDGTRWGAYLLLAGCLWIPLFFFTRVIEMGAIAAVVNGRLTGEPVETVGGAYRAVFSRSRGRLPGVALIGSVLGFLSYFFTLFVGTIYLGIGLSLVAPAVVLERRRVINAIKRSFSLSGSDRVRIFGVALLLSGILAGLAYGMGAFAGLGMALNPFGEGASAAARQAQSGYVEQAVGGLVAVAIEPLLAIAMILMYFDLRVRREGIDLAAQAESLGVPLAPDPFGDVASERVVRDQQRRQRKGKRP